MCRRRSILALAAVAVAVSVCPGGLRADPDPVTAARDRADAAIARWGAAQKAQVATRARFEALEQRIAALKKDSGPTASGELARLLKASVDADAELSARDRAVEDGAAAARASVVAAVSAVDERIRSLAPRLETGELGDRKQAARAINELRAARRALKEALARIDVPAALPRAWSRYAVRVDPLDGPRELGEKADFVEDARDKVRKKRDELAQLIREARQERALAEASATFRTDARHFDEEVRLGRVTRQSSGGGGALAASAGGGAAPPSADNASGKGTSQGAAGGSQPSAPPQVGAGAPASGVGGASAAGGASAPTSGNSAPGATPPAGGSPTPGPGPSPPTAPSAGSAGGTSGGGGAAPAGGAVGGSGNGSSSSSGGSGPGGAPMVSNAGGGNEAAGGGSARPAVTDMATPLGAGPGARLDPEALLRLRLEGLDGGAVDLDTLERLARDLDQLDRFLADRATQLRHRAQEMQSEEKR